MDTSVLLNVFTSGAHDPDERLDHSIWVLEAAEQGDHELVVPAIAVAELGAHPKIRSTEVMPREERRRRIRAVKEWIEDSRFVVAEITMDVASLAVDLGVEHQMKGADACIVAAAKLYGCRTLFSWDDDQLKLGDTLAGLKVENPARQGEVQQRLDFPEPRS